VSDEPNKLAENIVAADGPEQVLPDGSNAEVASAGSSADTPHNGADTESADQKTAADEAAVASPEGEDQTGEAGEKRPQLQWYILKVQSNREKSIAEALKRRVAVEGLDEFFGQIIVPTEKVTEFKGGKRRVVQRKLYPGYLMVQMLINDDTWFLVRETPGIGDFTGSGGKPTPMQPHEVHKIVSTQEEKTDETPKLKINFREGDRVKINEGTFENFEGVVSSLDQGSGRVVVMINIFGRSTPVELEYWQVEVM